MGSPSPLVHRGALGRTAVLAQLCLAYSFFNTCLWNHLLLSFTTVPFAFISLQRGFLHAFYYPSHTFLFPLNAAASRWPAHDCQLLSPLALQPSFGLLIAHFSFKCHESSLRGLGWLHTELFSTLEGLLPNWRNSSYVLTEYSPGTLTPQLSGNRSGLLTSGPLGPFCTLQHGLLSRYAISMDLTLFFVEHIHSPVFNSFQLTAGHRVPSS